MSGPAVVAVGGGHGQAQTLRAVRRYAGRVTAVVAVSDDGGSSGRLRRQLDIIPPGDLRMCLVALAGEPSLLAEAMNHRFEAEDLAGHALGNLVVAGLMAVAGDPQQGLDEAARLLRAAGRVVPATYEPVVLKAEAASGSVEGQSAVARTDGIRRVSLVPADPPAAPAALEALAAADQVVLGPGSLFTSVLAAAVVPQIAAGLAAAAGRRVYVANLRPQARETEGFDVAAHVAALAAHGIEVDVVVADPAAIDLGPVPVPVVEAELTAPGGAGHDPARLADVLRGLVG